MSSIIQKTTYKTEKGFIVISIDRSESQLVPYAVFIMVYNNKTDVEIISAQYVETIEEAECIYDRASYGFSILFSKKEDE